MVSLLPRPYLQINSSIDLNNPKVVTMIDTAKLGDKTVYCR